MPNNNHHRAFGAESLIPAPCVLLARRSLVVLNEAPGRPPRAAPFTDCPRLSEAASATAAWRLLCRATHMLRHPPRAHPRRPRRWRAAQQELRPGEKECNHNIFCTIGGVLSSLSPPAPPRRRRAGARQQLQHEAPPRAAAAAPPRPPARPQGGAGCCCCARRAATISYY